MLNNCMGLEQPEGSNSKAIVALESREELRVVVHLEALPMAEASNLKVV